MSRLLPNDFVDDNDNDDDGDDVEHFNFMQTPHRTTSYTCTRTFTFACPHIHKRMMIDPMYVQNALILLSN